MQIFRGSRNFRRTTGALHDFFGILIQRKDQNSCGNGKEQPFMGGKKPLYRTACSPSQGRNEPGDETEGNRQDRRTTEQWCDQTDDQTTGGCAGTATCLIP